MKLNYFQGALYPWRFCVIVGLLLAKKPVKPHIR